MNDMFKLAIRERLEDFVRGNATKISVGVLLFLAGLGAGYVARSPQIEIDKKAELLEGHRGKAQSLAAGSGAYTHDLLEKVIKCGELGKIER